MTFESFIPLKCWIAPEIPAAMYKSGATTFPVWPTCQSFGQKPASTAARDAPTAAPNLSANASRMGKFSPDLIPRPPLTTIDALPRSGRSDLETDSLTHSALSNATTSLTVSTESAGQSTNGALSKLVGRIDNTFVPVSFDTTFPRTFPAYIGRTYVFSSSMSRMSVTGETSRSAAARGTMELPNLDDVPTTTLQSLEDATAWIAAATVSPTTCF
mmetsp:Transcript_54483/g.132233  ORF Transcript_54483/g.132233 Transcript_54483/m.132233 type:complete len:215 (-) Transcript_54483:449-1093(-)